MLNNWFENKLKEIIKFVINFLFFESMGGERVLLVTEKNRKIEILSVREIWTVFSLRRRFLFFWNRFSKNAIRIMNEKISSLSSNTAVPAHGKIGELIGS